MIHHPPSPIVGPYLRVRTGDCHHIWADELKKRRPIHKLEPAHAEHIAEGKLILVFHAWILCGNPEYSVVTWDI